MTKAPIIVIRKSVDESLWMKVSGGRIHWVNNKLKANTYSSKYAAKQHMKFLCGNFEGSLLEQVEYANRSEHSRRNEGQDCNVVEGTSY